MSAVWNWVVLAVAVAGSVVVVEGLRRLLAGRRLTERWPAAGAAAARCAAPGFTFAVVVSASAAMPYGDLAGGDGWVRHLVKIAVIGATTWLVLRIAYALSDPALERLNNEGTDSRRARRARTQMLLVRRIAAAVVWVIAVGAALFTFPEVRAVGAGMLASAGVAGIVVGVAAKPAVGNLFAGLQVAFSDALRLDDVVVVDEQWGVVEELTLSNVVIRLWDDRRLVLPVSRFTEGAFENWTRRSSRILGSVILNVDWTVPVKELRAELGAFLREHERWDRRDWSLDVTDVLPNGLVQLRAVMSAADSSAAWALRCDVREHLIEYVRDHYPAAMPRLRTELSEPDGPVSLIKGDGPGS